VRTTPRPLDRAAPDPVRAWSQMGRAAGYIAGGPYLFTAARKAASNDGAGDLVPGGDRQRIPGMVIQPGQDLVSVPPASG
jgi:hypothetical protein